ncbi:Glutaredoxin-C6 [Hibiscus syriacus]|uniref:Glutaredoxin-C6 n=1 Tax=Hibiscus syriacus TaxID=106335 RepID=A0A6A2YUF2_HIBSY|nr:glutaredoxin-C6-like [Hibiscus syriacus]KAE8682632.1 Glutaredoxin-C6 [Hibiscus syriacus]
MQRFRSWSSNIVQLDLSPLPQPPSSPNNIPMSTTTAISCAGFSIYEEESTEARIKRLISENPVIIFSRTSCCMCHVMKKLLATIGVHPTVIELDDHEITSLPTPPALDSLSSRNSSPTVFIGGTSVGGLESLVALHLSGHLVPKLVEVGALWV